MSKIRTKFAIKPGSIRDFDWESWIEHDETKKGFRGYGETAAAAIDDLLEIIKIIDKQRSKRRVK